MTRDSRQPRLRVGVVGAGRVGAVLAAALRAAGHDVVAAAGESDASRRRIADLLPGVPTLKPTAVARRRDLLVLAPAAAVGARVAAMHPAMTFTGTAIDLDRLAGCVFGLTAEESERDLVAGLVADLGGRPMWVPEEMRTL